MAITLCNNTNYIAQFLVQKGEQVIARLPGIEPNAQMSITATDTFEVIARTIVDGNTYTSAPLSVTGSMGFLAQFLQVVSQGTYEFNVVEMPSAAPNQLSFQQTCINPVTFTITKDGKPLQNVVVSDSFRSETLDISDTFYIYAVINGITTEVVTTQNPDATVTALADTADCEPGYFTLSIQ